MSRETLVPQGAQSVVGLQQRTGTQATVSSQRIVRPGNIVETNAVANHFNLVPGNYGDYQNTKPAQLSGRPGTVLGAGAYRSTVQASTLQHEAAVTVHSTASGQWMNSRFTAVKVEQGAKAKFTNCRFSGKLENAGALGDVVCIGCFFDEPPVNVTVIG
jgi:hypothetical protein